MDRTSIVDEIARQVIAEAATQNKKTVAQEQAPLLSKRQVPVAYYHAETKSYFMMNERGQWTARDTSSFKRYLERVVFRHLTKKDGRDEYIEDFIITTQNKFDVSVAMPIAGFTTGEVMMGQDRVLVTREATYLQPRKGEWPLLRGILETLLPGQLDYLFAWLKSAFNALWAGPPFRPGQLLVIAGPVGCGKSWFQNKITEMYGGRAASPFDYMMGYTDKNSELFYAEHLMIEDEASSPMIADRTHFGSKIKTCLCNQYQKFHKKFGEPVRIPPFWRMTATLNDNPESLLVMPPIKEDVVDKIIILKAEKAKFPKFGDDLTARREFDEAVTRELPAFIAFLKSWRIPEALKDDRFGCLAWQHPDLVEAINQLAPETELLMLIDEILPLTLDHWPYKGTAAKLQKILLENDKLGRVKDKLRHASTCGTYLARLKRSYPSRIEIDSRPGNKVIWIIKPDPKESEKPLTEEGV